MPTLTAEPEVADTASAIPVSRVERARALALAAGAPIIVSYAAISALLALILAATPGVGLSAVGVLGAAGPAWLAAFHVPVTLGGHQLGVLPLLPMLLVLALIARTSADAATRLGASTPAGARPVLVTVALTHAGFGAVLAAACSGASVRASPVVAFFACGALAGLAAVVGTGRRCGLLRAALVRADDVTRSGLRAGLAGMAGLLGAGAVVLGGALIGSWPTVVAVFRHDAPGFGAGLGMLLLSVAYLPNAVVGAASFAAGPGFSIGTTAFGPLMSHAGAVPPVPILAAAPAVPHRWLVLLVVLPAGIGAGVGWLVRGIPGTTLARCRAVGVAAVCVGMGFLVLAGLAGGALGGGRFDPVTVPAGLLAVAVFAWVAVAGSLVAWLAGDRIADSPVQPDPDPEPEPEPDAEPDPEPAAAAENEGGQEDEATTAAVSAEDQAEPENNTEPENKAEPEDQESPPDPE